VKTRKWLVKALRWLWNAVKWLWRKLEWWWKKPGWGRAITVFVSAGVSVGVVFLAQGVAATFDDEHEERIAKYTAEVYLDRMQIVERGLDDMLYDNERLGSFFPLDELAVPPSDDISLESTDPKGTVHDLDYAYGLLVLVFGPAFHASGSSSEAHLTPATEPLHHRLCGARTAVIEAVGDLETAADSIAGVGLETAHSAVAGKRCLPELVGRITGARHTRPIGPRVWVVRVYETAPRRTLFKTRKVRTDQRFTIRVSNGSYVVKAQTTRGRRSVKAFTPEVKDVQADEIRSVALKYNVR
jgi:hypothetical protein